MSRTEKLVFETALDAPPEKVWRALSIPEYRDRWLQPASDVILEMVSASDNALLTLRWLEPSDFDANRLDESLVTFELSPGENGGTWFRLTHEPVRIPEAANTNSGPPAMLLAA